MYKIDIEVLKSYVVNFAIKAIEENEISDIFLFDADAYLCNYLYNIKKEVMNKINHGFEYSDIGILDKAIMEKYCDYIFNNKDEISFISGYIEIQKCVLVEEPEEINYETPAMSKMLYDLYYMEDLNELNTEKIEWMLKNNYRTADHETRIALIRKAKEMIL